MNQIDNYPWEQYKDLKAEAAAVRKTAQEATKLILDASLRYKQKKLKARSKKQAADLAVLFKDLELYRNREEIRDAYGWDFITEAEADRLHALWDAREKYVKENGKFSDPVTELLERATRYINDEGRDLIELAGIPVPDEYDPEDLMPQIREQVQKNPGKATLFAMYLEFGDYKSNGYNDWFGNREDNSALDELYEILVFFSYEMSDDELQLQDGTHSLFMKEDE